MIDIASVIVLMFICSARVAGILAGVAAAVVVVRVAVEGISFVVCIGREVVTGMIAVGDVGSVVVVGPQCISSFVRCTVHVQWLVWGWVGSRSGYIVLNIKQVS